MNHFSFEVFSASRTLLEFCIFMVIYMYTIPEQNSSDQHLQRICQIMKWNYWFHILSLSLNYKYIQYLRQGDRHLAAVNYIFSNLSQSICTTMFLSIFFCMLRFYFYLQYIESPVCIIILFNNSKKKHNRVRDLLKTDQKVDNIDSWKTRIIWLPFTWNTWLKYTAVAVKEGFYVGFTPSP